MEIQIPNRGTVGVIDIINHELIRTIARATPDCEFFINQEIEAKEPETYNTVLFYPFSNQDLLIIKGLAVGIDDAPARFNLSFNASSIKIKNKYYFFNYESKEWEQVTTITKSEIEANNKRYEDFKNQIETNQKDIENLKTDNQDLKNQIQTNQTDIETLKTEIQGLKDGRS